jgi:Cellulose binding domain
VARSLMMTPWFAAGAGIVIAAAMAVDSQAALTYAPSGPGVRCPVSGCSSPAPGHPPDLATAHPGVALKTPGAEHPGAEAASPDPRPGAEAGYQLGYQVIGRWPSGFVAMITMPGDLKPGPWSLQFAFPSARIDRVWGARWQPSRNGNGGTARGTWQWPGRPDARQLTVSATGTPTDPSRCRLDGISCGYR